MIKSLDSPIPEFKLLTHELEPVEKKLEYIGPAFKKAVYGNLYSQKIKQSLDSIASTPDIIIGWRENESVTGASTTAPVSYYYPALLVSLARQFKLFALFHKDIQEGKSSYLTVEYPAGSGRRLPIIIFDRTQTTPEVIPKIIEYSLTGELPNSGVEVIMMGRAVGDSDLEEQGHVMVKEAIRKIIIRINSTHPTLLPEDEDVARETIKHKLYPKFLWDEYRHLVNPYNLKRLNKSIAYLDEFIEILRNSDVYQRELMKLEWGLSLFDEQKVHGVESYCHLLAYLYSIVNVVNMSIYDILRIVREQEAIIRNWDIITPSIDKKLEGLNLSGLDIYDQYLSRPGGEDNKLGLTTEEKQALLDLNIIRFEPGQKASQSYEGHKEYVNVTKIYLERIRSTLERFIASIEEFRARLRDNHIDTKDEDIKNCSREMKIDIALVPRVTTTQEIKRPPLTEDLARVREMHPELKLVSGPIPYTYVDYLGNMHGYNMPGYEPGFVQIDPSNLNEIAATITSFSGIPSRGLGL